MNIGLVNEYFPPFVVGGAELSTYYLGRVLVEQGHCVTVITPNFGGKSFEMLEGMRVHRVPFPQRLSPGQEARQIFLSNPLFQMFLAFKIFQIGRREKLDVLQAENTEVFPATFLGSRWLGRPAVAAVRDVSFYQETGRPSSEVTKLKDFLYGRWGSLNRRIKRRLLPHFSAVVAVSQSCRSLLLQGNPGLSDKKCFCVYTIPPQINGEILGTEGHAASLDMTHAVGYFGKISEGKGVSVLLQAIPKILEGFPEATFVFVTRHPHNLQTLLVSVSEKERKRVRIFPAMANHEALRLMHRLSCVVVPSVREEPLSRVLLEAMALGKAIVASRTGGTPELLEDGNTGLLVEPGDVAGLAEAVLKVLRSQSLQRQLGEGARSSLKEKLSKEKVVDPLLKVYQVAVSLKKAHP